MDTRRLFRPLSADLVALLRALPPDKWRHATIAGNWTVREIVAHLVDGTLRRLSLDRDRHQLPAPPDPLRAEREFVAYINALNADWIAAAKRLSGPVLTDLYAQGSAALADYVEALDLEAPGRLGVSWAGEESSVAWLDIGRDFTEHWHHQMQIRLAIDAPPLTDPEYLRAVLAIAVHALPHAYRHLPVREGSTIAVEATGPSGGVWTLERDSGRWKVWEGTDGHPATRIRLTEDAAWRLFFNAIPEKEAPEAIQVEGRVDFARPLLRARAVIV